SAVRAMAAYAVANVALAAANVEDALGHARESSRLWSDIGSPNEAARARVLVARALRELGDHDSAAGELAVARRAFAEIGAVPAVDDVDRLLGRSRPGVSLSARSRYCGWWPRVGATTTLRAPWY
ncbi:MAG TPA: hypothetical protein VFW54_06505, partial [Propionibacteriaceae bacterium]|nr:hypothetical protein [Propionibacteriaceae bacterium]